MKFGVREICDVVFKAKADVRIGGITFRKDQPVLYIDSAKTSTIEGAATTVYATGGRGNTRLIAWEGEKTLTFTVEDALLSPAGFAILSGAGLLKGKKDDGELVHVHMTSTAQAASGSVDLTDALEADEVICTEDNAKIFVLPIGTDGGFDGEPMVGEATGKTIALKKYNEDGELVAATDFSGACFVDYYVSKKSEHVSELQIDAENFAGYYYVEASTLFRRQDNGKDMPAQITFPNVKIQSNFTFNMASTGDPSTFTFTMDAMPGYTYFEPTRRVLCAIQIVEDTIAVGGDLKTVFPCELESADGE